MADLSGPKIRIGTLTEDRVELKVGDLLRITAVIRKNRQNAGSPQPIIPLAKANR
jgi:pyruvate kinase